ncbi:cyclase family protein [Nocardioides sp. NPDC006273]|uniref:cyclase family protein n=1 Tax=Nocardioides sp. NPDC006273 TaxID=3155598 RepID=UPI0033B877D4
MPRPARTMMSRSEFEELHTRLRRTDHATVDAANTVAASSLVRTGEVVSAGEAPAVGPAGPVGRGSPYRLHQWRDQFNDWHAVNDRIELDIHGSPSMTHIDALCHFGWDGNNHEPVWGGDDLDALADGIAGRGVLLDFARDEALGAVPPGSVVTPEDIELTLSAQGARVGRGDMLWLRFGRVGKRIARESLGSQAAPGLSIECADWLADISPALVITDCGLDGTPSEVAEVPVPWHILLLTSLRIPIVDLANLSTVAAACAEAGRWDFLSVVAPLHLPGASGSPVNPLAIF